MFEEIAKSVENTDWVESGRRFYERLKSNPNNFSFWFPHVKDCGIRCPESVIIPVPHDVMNSFFMERNGDADRVRTFVRDTVMPAIPEDFGNKVFLKNGCFSNKFNFEDCSPDRTEDTIYNSILHVNMDSFCYDTGGNAEIVIRRFIGRNDSRFSKSIYNGMRLRPEIRVFYDFDTNRVLYSTNYWDWNYCHDVICDRNMEDKPIYEEVYPVIDRFIKEQTPYVENLVAEKLKNVPLLHIWSADLMYAENDWWLIDMAIGPMSAYWDPDRLKETDGDGFGNPAAR